MATSGSDTVLDGLDLRRLLCGEPNRVRYVKRFSTCRILSQESVAEHSFFVALYAMILAEWCDTNSRVALGRIDRGVLAGKALFHDMEEARTGDMPRFVKHANARILSMMEELGQIAFVDVFSDCVESKMLGTFHEHWMHSKDKSIEGRIVSFSDYLSVLGYVLEELHNANTTMREHLECMREYSNTFEDPAYEFLRPLILQVNDILDEEGIV